MMGIRNLLGKYLDTRSLLYRFISKSPLNLSADRALSYIHRFERAALNFTHRTRRANQDQRLAEYLTIVIKTFERPAILRRLVKTIKTLYPLLRIVVVDDSAAPCQVAGAEVFSLPYDSGVSAGRSMGLAQVKTPYFLSLDDDFIFFNGTSLEGALKLMEKYPEIDIMGGEVVHLPFLRKSGPGVLRKSVNGGALPYSDRESLMPVGARVGPLACYDKVPQFYIARTARVAEVGWDSDVKRLDHSVFFARAKGRLLTVFNPELIVLHGRTPFSKEYVKKRYDFESDLQLIRSRYSGASW